MIYPAHILYTESKITKVQTVEEHCLSTSQIAAMHLKNIHLDSAGYLAGLVHDMGRGGASLPGGDFRCGDAGIRCGGYLYLLWG